MMYCPWLAFFSDIRLIWRHKHVYYKNRGYPTQPCSGFDMNISYSVPILLIVWLHLREDRMRLINDNHPHVPHKGRTLATWSLEAAWKSPHPCVCHVAATSLRLINPQISPTVFVRLHKDAVKATWVCCEFWCAFSLNRWSHMWSIGSPHALVVWHSCGRHAAAMWPSFNCHADEKILFSNLPHDLLLRSTQPHT